MADLARIRENIQRLGVQIAACPVEDRALLLQLGERRNQLGEQEIFILRQNDREGKTNPIHSTQFISHR